VCYLLLLLVQSMISLKQAIGDLSDDESDAYSDVEPMNVSISELTLPHKQSVTTTTITNNNNPKHKDEREVLSMRERILNRVRKDRAKMEKSGNNQVATDEEDEDSKMNSLSASQLLKTHFSLDIERIRSNNLHNEEQLLNLIRDYGVSQNTEDNLTFRSENGYSDDEDTVLRDDLSSSSTGNTHRSSTAELGI
jgi:hypothetical protein